MRLPLLEPILNPLRSHVGFTLVSVLTLGSCWGACLAVVVLFQSSFLRPPPFADADELVWVRSHMPSEGINHGIIQAMQRDMDGGEGVAGYTAWEINAPLEVSASRSTATNVSIVATNLTDVLQIAAYRGRTFVPEDDDAGAATPMLISHRLWSEAFGADDSVIEGIFNLDGRPARVIGVLPPGMEGPAMTAVIDAYIPLGHYHHFFGEGFVNNLNFHSMAGVLRVPVERDRGVLLHRLEATFVNYVDQNPEKHPLYPMIYDWRSDAMHQRADLLQAFRLYGAVMAALFLIAIANSVILVLLRAAWRAPEILTKISLGAGRTHLLREFAIEAVVLCMLISLAGFVMCWGMLSAVAHLLPNAIPPHGLEVFSGPFLLVVVITLALQFGLFAVIPAVWIRRMQPGDIIREGRGTSRRIRALPALAVLQVAVTTILVVFSVQFALTSHRIVNFDPGYRTDGIVTFSYGLRHLNLADDDEWDVINQAVESAVAELPVVDGVARGSLDFLGPTNQADFYFEDELHDDERRTENITYRISAGPGMLDLMGIRILEGRDFHVSDRESEDYVVLVSRSFAETHFPGEHPIGKRLRFFGLNNPLTTIIGITEDFHIFPFDNKPPAVVMLAWGGRVIAKVRGPVDRAMREIDTFLSTEFGHIGIPPVRSARERIYQNTEDTHIAARIVTSTAALAVILSLFGWYVVFSFSTTLRRRDYAIRMALGATTRQIAGFAGVRFAAICVIGLLIGILATFLVSPYVGSVLGEDRTNEPIGYALALLFVALFGTTVSATSALRTRRIDPATELME